MTEERVKRKLSAILSADVAGYSRLMGEDEVSTVRTLEAYRKVMSDLIEQFRGRVVDSPGDNLLSEFSSVVDAVQCAVEIQEDLRIRNAELPEKRKMQFRIGINLGDVIAEGYRIYGDGVNVAARIESLAEAGGICVSRSVYDQVKRKIDIKYDYLGEHEVKNIDDPVRIYKVLMDSIPDNFIQKKRPKGLGSLEEKSSPMLGKPSIAVLPFLDLSPESDQGYFVDGLSEEILNGLAQIADLSVTGRTSSFSFKDSNKTVQEIAGILGVGNVLEGSVRKADSSLRITVQLLRAADGFHLWSKTYDRELKDIFKVQEDIAGCVADELKLTLGIDKSFKQLGGTDNLEAYEHYLMALGRTGELFLYEETQEDRIARLSRALESIDAAIKLDPEFAIAWAFLSMIHLTISRWVSADQVSLEHDKALQAALKSIELEPRLGQAHLSLGAVNARKGHLVEAEWAYRKGMELTAEAVDFYNYGLIQHYVGIGYFGKCKELLEMMIRKDPLKAEIRASYILNLGVLGHIDQAEEEYKRGKTIFGENWLIGDLSIFFVRLGSKDTFSFNEIPEALHWISPTLKIGREHMESPEEGLAELRRVYENEHNLSVVQLINIGGWAHLFGDPEFTLNATKRAFRLSTSSLYIVWIPSYDKVRQLPQFKEFIREIGLDNFWKKFGWPDLCHPVGDDFVCDWFEPGTGSKL